MTHNNPRPRIDSRMLELGVIGPLTYEDMYIVRHNALVQAKEIPRPAQGSLDDYFFNNSGNFWNGAAYALISDLFINIAIDKLSAIEYSSKNPVGKAVKYFETDRNRINIASGLISSLAIGFFETTGIRNVPDWKDIPAGVAGALLHTGLRYYSLKKQRKAENSSEISYQTD